MTINVKEINNYRSDSWTSKFLQHPGYQHIIDDHAHVVFSYKEMTLLKAALHDTVYEHGRNFLKLYNILDAVPYYYIDYILEKNPKHIIDLGCGLNVFKPYVPGILGVDADLNAPADTYDFFDQEYAQGHTNHFDGLISINTIHFAPIDAISNRLTWIANLVEPGYRGFVSFNIETWLMHTESKTINMLFGKIPKFDDIVNYVNDQILLSRLNFLVVDWPVLHITEHSTIRDDLNGNIRLVFEQ
jgi:hypothetical protein